MKHTFECIRCGYLQRVSKQKYIYFLGSRCAKCGGEIIEKQGEANAS